MAFGGYAPEYTCDGVAVEPGECSVNGTACSSFEFSGETTVVSEWGLICDLAWVKRLIISLQMLGIMILIHMSMGVEHYGPPEPHYEPPKEHYGPSSPLHESSEPYYGESDPHPPHHG